MVVKKRITKKDLKKPDEFVTWGSRAMDYVTARKTYIGLGALVLALVVLAVFFHRQHVIANEERAFTLLGNGINLYHQEDKRAEALDALTTVIDDYKGTEAGKIALLYRGRLYMLQQDYDRAIADFRLILSRTAGKFLHTIALNALGTTYMAKGECKQGIESFEQVLASGEGWIQPFVLIRIGMCWESLGDEDKAAEAYQKSLKVSPPLPWANLAKLRLKKLGKTPE